MEDVMRASRWLMFLVICTVLLMVTSCARKPSPGRIIECVNQGVTVTLANGWEGEVVETDWLAWKRILKGREDFMWVFPPITARNIPVSEVENTRNFIRWRFKGVEGTFDVDISPSSPDFPVPAGLWSMDPTKFQILYSQTVPLPWPGLSGTDATVRMYEHVRGMGDVSAIWHSYVVTFNYGPNAYEFVMLIPSSEIDQNYIDIFWASIENVSIDTDNTD